MNKIKYFSLFILTIIISYLWGCGGDETVINNNNATPPNINMKVGNVYTFNVDSLDTNGNIRKTRIVTKHTYLSQGRYS